jgi:c-di-GMP phosphodiesterase
MLNKIVGKIRANKDPLSAEPTAGHPHSPPAHNDAFRRLNEVAPLASEVAAATAGETESHAVAASRHSQSIVCREAILGRDQRVAGYAFMLRHRVNERVRDSSTHVRGLYDEVLLRNLQAMQIQQLLEHRIAFIALSATSLFLPIVEHFPSEGTVYVVGPNEELAADAEAILGRLDYLKSQGYRLALHGTGVDLPGLSAIVPLADFLLLDIGDNDIPATRTQLELVGKLAPSVQFAATNITTREDFNVCLKFPFSLYQGPFVTHREDWNAGCLDAARGKTVMLLNRLRADAELPELSRLIRRDPALVVRLMRYVNSAGMGLLHKVGSIDQALMLLGRQKLYRWVTLLLFAGGESNAFMRPLLENALIRARLAELLAKGRLDSAESDELFLAGMISLMDVLLGMPMEAVIKQLGLPKPFHETLLEQAGKYVPYLRLAIACEKHDSHDISGWSAAIGLDEKAVNALHIEAMVWAQQSTE